MNKHPINIHSKQRQSGVALAISLILLTVITLLSLSSMRSANLNTKIAVNHQHKLFAFQAAEGALSNLLNANTEELTELEVPGNVADVAAANPDYFEELTVANSPTVSADLTLDLLEVSPPGKYMFSGFGMNVVTIRYQADSVGEVVGSNNTSHNRMEVVLVRGGGESYKQTLL